MSYKRQVNRLADYLERQCKDVGAYALGAEFEHFVVNEDDLKFVSYYGDKGIEYILSRMMDAGWEGMYEDSYLVGLIKDGDTVTLEPGGQVELSVKPCKTIYEIEKRYFDFLNDIIPILHQEGKILLALGYQPESSIKDIPWNPKERYKYMSEYLKDKGCYAHNMMKGSAALQVSIDYSDERDFMRKFKVANKLSPIVSAVFDNSPFFEGRLFEKKAARAMIWSSCDRDRCGIMPYTFDEDFGFEKYAEYILNNPPIFIHRKGKMEFTGKTPFKDIFDPDTFTDEEIEHVLTMFFPDVRAKQYVEIRMADSVPYPLSFSFIALIKGLFYDVQSYKKFYEYMDKFDGQQIFDGKINIINDGIFTKLGSDSIKDIMQDIVQISYQGLNNKEKLYLKSLESILQQGMTPADIIRDRLGNGKKEALQHCILNDLVKKEKVADYEFTTCD
ncbi:MAG: glutamate-cysteine ligase family protein [Clostridia bacterium]|nr:glutamate-cysteine ligase family protein [Clostridia bacterium]